MIVAHASVSARPPVRHRLAVAVAVAVALVLALAASSFGQTVPATMPSDELPRTFQLKSGERVTGVIVEESADAIRVDSAALGPVTIRRANVGTIIGPDGKPEASVEQVAGAREISPAAGVTPADRGLFGSGLLVGWTRQFEFGLTGTAGTTDSTSLNVQFNAGTDNDRYRATLGANYFLTVDDGTQSRNQTRAFGTYDRRLDGGPWFVFARSQYDNDSLQNFENRVSLFGGPGYEFVRTPAFELLGRVGLGYTREFGGNYPDGYEPSRVEGLAGLDAKWAIDATQSLVASAYYFPTIGDFAYGRFVTTAAYQIDLKASRGIAFKVGVEHTHELITAGDDDHNNVKYFTNVVLKL